MAKVFTIDIPYRADVYPALVTVRSSGDEHLVKVHFFDSALQDDMPEGELQFTVSTSMRTPALPSNVQNKDLYFVIRDAVISHLKGADST